MKLAKESVTFPNWNCVQFSVVHTTGCISYDDVLALCIQTLHDLYSLTLGLKPSVSCLQVLQLRLVAIGRFSSFWLQNVASSGKSVRDSLMPLDSQQVRLFFPFGCVLIKHQ